MTQLLQLGAQPVHLRLLQQGLQASVRSRTQVRAALHLRHARARDARPPRLAGRHPIHVHNDAACAAEAERPPTPQYADASGRLCGTPALAEDGPVQKRHLWSAINDRKMSDPMHQSDGIWHTISSIGRNNSSIRTIGTSELSRQIYCTVLNVSTVLHPRTTR